MEETWDQIGAKLRQAREKAGMAVDDVVFRAKIPRTVVEALEAEDFSVFSSPTYAKSFLRQYSEFLGVDAEPWLDALEPAAYVGGDAALQPAMAGSLSGGSGSQPRRGSRDHARHEESAAPDSSGKWSAFWLMAMTAAIVFGIVKGYDAIDKKFGGEAAPVKRTATPAPPKSDEAAPEAQTQQPPAGQTTVQEKKEVSADVPASTETGKETGKEEAPRAPRAIIVRD